MRYTPYFVTLVFTCVIIGIIFSTINNDFIIVPPEINQQVMQNIKITEKENENKNKNEEKITNDDEIWKQIRIREKELKEKEEERRKKIEEEIRKKEEEKRKKAKEEEKIKDEEEEEEAEIDEEEAKMKAEEERKRKEEARKEIERKERLKKEEAERIRKENEQKSKKQKEQNIYEEEKKEIKEKEKEKGKESDKINKDKENEKENDKINIDKENEKENDKTNIEKEKEKEFEKNIEENIINNINREENKNKENKLTIACAYATDNAYVYPTLVAMTSLTENAAKTTFYDIYVMINPDFTEENKKVLKSVEEKHPTNCEVIFIDMGDKFKDEKTNQKITTPAYYRLELHNLLPDVKRIVWMDGDTAVFEDLTELITLDMKGNYIMGFLDSIPEAIERFNIQNATVLCSGVLLMDLEALRKNNMTEKFRKFMIEEKEKINQHDQTVINVVCQGKIAPLPPKYGIWCFEAEKYALKHNERQRPHLRYNKDEFIKAYYHPAILHYVWPKPFWKRKKPVFNTEWWNYAKISGYYNEVYNKSPKYVARLLAEKLSYLRYQYHYL